MTDMQIANQRANDRELAVWLARVLIRCYDWWLATIAQISLAEC